ncbi:type IA DNA topoisomerase [Allorhodopirellula heiligendammensis]|uniref:Uncharacterized protein n=1 Tax=Allorhodopirellula heiligendammensis TaxID=2714739 RepID=A0A5C6BH36_9BACT|nr:type IA DNA topoisomerase [Allorhodopirellula heiligendammensis]TWU10811.1 hypothetical protein Poly21_47170 [Allorhodopirellula heiligendammensis]
MSSSLSTTLSRLVNCARALASSDYSVRSKSYNPTDDDWTLGRSDEPMHYNGSWPTIIQFSREVLAATITNIDKALELLPQAEELSPDASPLNRWKPRVKKTLLCLNAEISRHCDGTPDVRSFVSHGRLPEAWLEWVADLDEYIIELESIEERELPTLSENDIAILTEMCAIGADKNSPITRAALIERLNWGSESKRAMDNLKKVGYVKSVGKLGFIITDSGEERAKTLG